MSQEANEDVQNGSLPVYRNHVGLIADIPNFPADWQQVVEKVRLADELGFDTIWLSESWGYELFTSLNDLVRATKRIKIGAGIANIYSRTPALLASTIATLDERSEGRMILGLGSSGANVIEHWHGMPFQRPVQRTREYVEIIQMILRGEKLYYKGDFFQLERGFKLRFTPPRADLPIYIAAMGPKNVRQTGEIADGILPIYWPSDRWGELRSQLYEGAQLAGRPAGSAAIAPFLTTAIVSEQASEAEQQQATLPVASILAFYVGKMGVYYANMLTRQGFGPEVQAIQAGWQVGPKAATAAVSPHLLEAVSLIGTPREIVARLDRWAEAGVDEPALSMPPGPVEQAETQLGALMAALTSPR